MSTTKKLGIWMDHASAHLTAFPGTGQEPLIIKSAFTHEEKIETIEKSEKGMHNLEQHQQAAYYKALGEEIRKYDTVVLFGPTDAKTELLNILRTNHLFEKIEIEIRPADKMTATQQSEFLRNYFIKHISN